MRNCLILLGVIILFSACNKGDVINTASTGKAALVFPAKDALCTTGTNITTTQSTITFSWSTSEHTDSYELTIKNLVTNTVITKITTNNQLAVTLDANAPYTWHIKSISVALPDGVLSDEWRFYNAGLGITSYAPFPATMVSPTYGQAVTAVAGKVTLTWTGNDVDNDIVNYDLKMGTSASPAILSANITTNSVSVSVTSGTTYYWQIVTRDSHGNLSNSDVYKFTVN